MPISISVSQIKKVVDEAGLHFEWCWQIFSAFKSGNTDDIDATSIRNFQLRLLDGLELLDGNFKLVKREQRRLVSEKQRYNSHWFRGRMAKLSSFCDSLKETMAVGRAIGDGFAWIFYANERDLVEQHLRSQRQILLPPKIGALGERLTLERLQGFDNKLLIYHGTTTFLRLGDISFVDLKRQSIAAIGELKTRKLNDQEVNVHLVMTATSRDGLPRAKNVGKSNSTRELDAPLGAKLNRQLETIGKAMTDAKNPEPSEKISVESVFHYDVVERVVSRSNFRRFEFENAGDGLLIGALRVSRSRSLGSRFFDKLRKIDEKILGIEKIVISIVDESSNNNSIVLGSIGAGDRDLPLDRTSIPFVFWPISPLTLYNILFGHVVVITIFNPAHFWSAIESRGFLVELDQRGKFRSATKSDGTKKVGLEHTGYFLNLISRALLSQGSALAMIDQSLEMLIDRADGRPGRIEIKPRLH
jgi:hypothetical protein